MIRAVLTSPRLFLPTIFLIVLDLGAAARYAFERSSGRVTYWLAAAVLTYSVTWMKS